jgi:hypothetical protein
MYSAFFCEMFLSADLYRLCKLENSNGQLKKFLFLVTAAILNGGQGCRTQFERDPPRDYPCQVWFNLVQRFQRKGLGMNIAASQQK